MLKFYISVLKPCIQGRISFSFAKILKLAPKIGQNSQAQPIKSIILKGRQLLARYDNQKDPIKKLKDKDQEFVVNQFVQFIKSLNMVKFQQNSVKLTGEQALQTLKSLRNINFINQWVDLLISRHKSYNIQERKYVTKFFTIISLIFKRVIYEKRVRKDFDFTFFKNYMQKLNQYMIIIQLNQSLVHTYIYLTNFCIKTNSVDQNRSYFINQKFIIDLILDTKQNHFLSRSNLYELINYITLSTLMIHYPSRFQELSRFVLNKLQPSWHQHVFYQQRMPSVFRYFSNLRYRSPKILQGALHVMSRQVKLDNLINVATALACYINLQSQVYVDREVPVEIANCLKNLARFIKIDKEHDKLAKNEMLKLMTKTLEYLIPTLYRASIWQEDIWIIFLEWLATERNYQQIKMIDIFTIFDLIKIDHDIIPVKVIEAIENCKNKLLLVNNFRVEDVNLEKMYYKEYDKKSKNNFYSIQKQTANNLRSVSGTIVKTEVLIHFFMVDILMNDKIVIQINSSLHYIFDQKTDQKLPNIKSTFRKRIIQKLGYKFMEFQIDQFTEGNVQFLKTVRQLIKDF